MDRKRERVDFVKRLESQLRALRGGCFDELDVELLIDEWEGVVAQYRGAVRDHAERLIQILMRPYYVHGDWNDLYFEWDMLRSALKDSPSLAKRAAADIRSAYRPARLRAELHGEHGWPKRCPWKGLDDLLAAVKARNAEYIALERAGDADFANLHRAPWKSIS
jgi:Domain of unknown function DUF29